MILQRCLELRNATLAVRERGGEIVVTPFEKFVFDSKEIDMANATCERGVPSIRGRRAPGGTDARFPIALYPSGLTAETEIEVDYLYGESMCFQITNGLAMV